MVMGEKYKYVLGGKCGDCDRWNDCKKLVRGHVLCYEDQKIYGINGHYELIIKKKRR